MHELSASEELPSAAIARHIRQVDDALTMLGGDFNYVTSAAARRSLGTMNTSGGRDNGEEQHFGPTVGNRFGLQEMHQEEFTHASAFTRSRLRPIPHIRKRYFGLSPGPFLILLLGKLGFVTHMF